MSPHNSAPQQNTERRKAERNSFPVPKGRVFLWTTTDSWQDAQVVDLAPGGIGVVVESEWELEPGFSVQVEHDKQKFLATVESVDRTMDGRHRIGLSWAFS